MKKRKILDKRNLLNDLLSKSITVRIEKLTESENLKQCAKVQDNLCESLKNGIAHKNCLVCGCKYKENFPASFRLLTEQERKLLSFEEGHHFLCHFCSVQLEKLDKLRKKIEMLQQEFDNALAVMKAVIKMNNDNCYAVHEDFETDDRSDNPPSDNEEGSIIYYVKSEMDVSDDCDAPVDNNFGGEDDIIVTDTDRHVELDSCRTVEYNFETDNNAEKSTSRDVAELPFSSDCKTTMEDGIKVSEPENNAGVYHNSNCSTTRGDGEEQVISGDRNNSSQFESHSIEARKIIWELCEISYSKMEGYKKHLHTWKHFVAEECKEAEKRREENNSDFFLCPNCDPDPKTYSSLDDLRKHYNDFHEKGPLVCKPCGKANPQGWDAFRKHVKGEKHLILKNSLNLAEEEVKAKLPFGCSQCLSRFTNETSLRCHINRHETGKAKIKKMGRVLSICETCGRRFATMYGLEIHRQAMHKKKIPDATSRKSLKEGTEQIKCLKCPKLFPNRIRMRDHFRLIHLKMGQNPSGYKCEECGIVLRSNHYLSKHMRIVHDNEVVKKERGNKRVTCPVPSCQKCIPHCRLYAHLEVKHFPCSFDGTDGIKCPFECGTNSGSEAEWVQHVNKCSIGKEAKDKTPTCQKCNAVFPSQFTRICHQLQTHPDPALACEFCSGQFTTAMALRLHVPTHPESRPYLCFKCGKSFRTPEGFQGHQSTVCYDDEEQRDTFLAKVRAKRRAIRERKRKFKCSKCGMGFIDEHKRKLHFDKVHSQFE